MSEAPVKIPQDEVEPTLRVEREPLPDKTSKAAPARELLLKNFASDEILALPFPEQKKFLQKNQLQDPDKFTRFRNIQEPSIIDEYLKGEFHGKIEGQRGQEWYLSLIIDGEVEAQHFQGEIAVELQDKSRASIGRSQLRGPLDDHIRVVDEGERSSLLIQPTGPDNAKLYQVFIGGRNREILNGNYYARNGEGKLQILGSFVLKKGAL